MNELEKRIEAIEKRNKRVETDKAGKLLGLEEYV